MSADPINRKDMRAAVATRLNTHFTNLGTPLVKKIYGYKRGKFDEGSPVINVLSGPIGRVGYGQGSRKWNNTIQLMLNVFVPDADEDNNWSEKDVEDRLDDIEYEIARWAADHRGPGANYADPTVPWQNLTYSEGNTTPVDDVIVGGKTYLMEMIPLTLEVQDD